MADGQPGCAHGLMQRRVQRYFTQLSEGCGRLTGCHTRHCASCRGGSGPLEPNSAAVKALELAQRAGELGFCADSSGYLDLKRLLDAPSEVASLVAAAFASPRLLGLSFPLERGEPDEPGLDWEQLDAFWRLVGETGDGLMDDTVGAIGRMLDADAADDRIGEAPGLSPRALVVLLACHALAEPHHHGILASAYALIAALGEGERDALRELWASAPQMQLRHAVRCAHEHIIIFVLENSLSDPVEEEVVAAVGCLKLLHRASEASATPLELAAFYNDGINTELAANDALVRQDHRRWQESDDFSFCEHPFLLEPAAKASVLKLNAMHQMSSEFESAVFRSIITMSMHSPYLVLRVRREHLIRDSLHQLASRSADVKKPLKVHFMGEEGVDEGGVAKEFFQLVMRQLFDPCWGMFVQDEKTREFWFNQNSLESSREFELVGKLIGIAIYNSVRLDVRFPHVVYKKLMRASCGFADLKRAFPPLAHGLQQLLDHAGDPRELCLTFALEYDVYGERQVAELKPGGAEVEVTSENRAEYVDLYSAYALTSSVSRQFDAFDAGFQGVCGGPALRLFRWEELELLICGSPDFDFEALQRATAYDDGFTPAHPTVTLFWKVMHSLEMELKRKFLVFSTGSDRVPIKGLGNLKLVISRHGGDESRLPSAHTCFNHLLLPEYKTEEVMRRQLLLAITDTEGFHIV